MNILEQFTAELNSHFFLAEFSFDKNTFRTLSGQQLELADHVVALPDALFVIQIKERNLTALTDTASVEEWFRQKVLKKGCGQIHDSIEFLQNQPQLLVRNCRGHQHDLASPNRAIIPLLLYSSGSTLPVSIAQKRHHISKRAGFVHILHILEYQRLCRILALPSELIAYFAYRQDNLLRNPDDRRAESILVAEFISEAQSPVTEAEAEEVLNQAVSDAPSFDISPILRRFGDKVSYFPGSGQDLDYYRILREFLRLTRAEMRGFKRLLTWAIEVAGGDASYPVRMQSLNTGTGFVVVPVPKGAFEKRLNALVDLTVLAKYDSKLEREVGLAVARDGEEIELDWSYLEFPWEQDSEMESALASNYPFRPKPRPQVAYRYPFNKPGET